MAQADGVVELVLDHVLGVVMLGLAHEDLEEGGVARVVAGLLQAPVAAPAARAQVLAVRGLELPLIAALGRRQHGLPRDRSLLANLVVVGAALGPDVAAVGRAQRELAAEMNRRGLPISNALEVPSDVVVSLLQGVELPMLAKDD